MLALHATNLRKARTHSPTGTCRHISTKPEAKAATHNREPDAARKRRSALLKALSAGAVLLARSVLWRQQPG